MDMGLNMNTVNQIPKGTILYMQNAEIESVSLVVKGRVLVYNTGTKIVCGPGSFLGVSDLLEGKYGANYYVADDVQVFPVPVKNIEDMENLLENRTDYRSTVVMAMNRQILELYKVHTTLEKGAASLKNFMENCYRTYKELGKKYSMNTVKLPFIDELPEMEAHDDSEDAMYFVECASIPVDVQKAYYAHGSTIAKHHMEEQVQMIGKLQEYCENYACYVQQLFEGVAGEEDQCLFNVVAQMALDMKKIKADMRPVTKLLDSIREKTKEVENYLVTKTGKRLSVDKDKMEQIYEMINTSNEETVQEEEVSAETAVRYAGVDTETIEKELTGSLGKILAYSQVSEETCAKFQQYILAFMHLHDKSSTDDDARKLRKNIANVFYEVYEAVFLRDYKEKSGNRLIELFLLYGFVDERLLSKEQLIELYCLEDEDDHQGPCKVYNAKQWLTAVLEGKKEPSKSEFDLDYDATLREMKKSGQLSEEDMEKAKHDQMQKFQYELKNMFRYNSRLVSGQISIFVPILYRDQFMGHLDQSLMTTNKVNSIINKITAIDYSVFYRESMQNDPEHGIEKEYIQLQVFPDIILLPNYGSNGSMWQEIEGRKRVSHGRFLFPIFAENDMEDIFIRVCGRYRWELCRTIQGTTWNDVKYKSLTSEYVDYVQFYKKNRALSEEKKEKLKMQIQKGRGNTREVFVLDYVLWVKNESTGSMRLNKVAREVLATYCPFVKEIRQRLDNQPLFQVAMARFKRESQKKVKDLDLRYRTLETKSIAVTPEMEKTMEFYRDM